MFCFVSFFKSIFGPEQLAQFWPYLRFRQIQLSRELRALAPHYVLAPLELELEPVQLFGREGGPRAFGPIQVEALGQDDLSDGAFGVCPEKETSIRLK